MLNGNIDKCIADPGDSREAEGTCTLVHESLHAQVYRYSHNDQVNPFGGRTGSVAIKVLTDANPDPEDVAKLDAEYILSRSPHLSDCDSIRASLRRDKFNGLQAIYLEWASGITLGEWIRSVHDRHNDHWHKLCDPQHMARLALRIVQAVSKLHQVGVIHNNLTRENFVVDTHSFEKEGSLDFSVKVIDLGSAVVLQAGDMPRGDFERDLFALGLILFELFSGINPLQYLDHGSPTNWEDVIVSSNSGIPPLHRLAENTLPYRVSRCTSTVISLLIRIRGDNIVHRYTSAREVEQDLCQMLDFPDRFISGEEVDYDDGTIIFSPDRLYGRQAETSMLLDSYLRVCMPMAKSEVAVVCGVSGTGKSSLVERLRKRITEKGGHFICGKFDSVQQLEPLSAIFAAFDEYCDTIMESGAAHIQQTRSTIEEQLGSDGISVLIGFIPRLRKLLGGGTFTPAAKVGAKEGHNRFKHMMMLFARAIATPSHPLVLFIDDMQWCDLASLDIIRTLAVDCESRSILFVLCYRDNEVNSDHPLSEQLRIIEAQGVHLTKIKVDKISEDAMNHLIADALCMPASSTTPLSCAVYEKTKGNAFFAIQFLKFLQNENLLCFSSVFESWHWDMQGIQSQNVSDGTVKLLTAMIVRLPAEVQGALQVAACLGRHCDEYVLELLSDSEMDEKKSHDFIDNNKGAFVGNDCLVRLLDIAVEQGLMSKAGSKYSFVHDQIHLTVYTLIDERARDLLHLRIGKRIWKKSPPAKLEEVLFLAVDQLNRGSMFMESSDEVDCARLNLRAGRKSMSLSLFLPAATYLKKGIDLLGPDKWEENYELSLHLCESCAEAEYCNGHFEEMGLVLPQIIMHARCFEEKLGAYRTLVNALSAQNRLQEAMQVGFLVLEQLGESFPDLDSLAESDVVSAMCRQEWVRTRNMLEEYTDETLVTMKIMEDRTKIAAMEFLKGMQIITHLAKRGVFPLVTFRMIQLSLGYGVCKETSFGFAMYGIILCASFDQVDRGYQFGRIALSLLDRFERKDCLAAVYVVVYGLSSHWKEHIGLALEPLLRGHHVGMVFGDIESAMMNARIYCTSSFQSGKPLVPLDEEMGVFCEQMRKFKQERLLILAVITRQTIHNLMGLSDDPLQLTGDSMNQDSVFEDSLQTKNMSVVWNIYLHRMCLACFFGDYELAAELAEKSQCTSNKFLVAFLACYHPFFSGLAFLALARKKEENKWKRNGAMALEKLRGWSVHASCNFANKVALLEAEFALVEGDRFKAGDKYDLSIALAGENGFVHERALACERAALFHLEEGSRCRASYYFDQAYDFYLQWGARGKAEQLRAHAHLLLSS